MAKRIRLNQRPSRVRLETRQPEARLEAAAPIALVKHIELVPIKTPEAPTESASELFEDPGQRAGG